MPGNVIGARIWNGFLGVVCSGHLISGAACSLAGLCCLLLSPALAQTNQTQLQRTVLGNQIIQTYVATPHATRTATTGVIRTTSVSSPAVNVLSASNMRTTLANDLRQVLKSAIADLDATKLPTLETARAELERELIQAEQYIELETPNGRAWSRFLQLEAIREEMNQPNPNPTRLAQLEVNLQQNYPGLESGPLLGLRNALADIKRAARYGSNPDRTIQVLNARMQALVELLDENPQATSSDVAEDVGRILNYLYESNQAPSAVSKLRGRFSTANAEIYASEALLNQVAARGVAEPSPVDECILGTRVLGQACLRGSVGVDLLPMHRGVSLNLNLSGNLTSQNRGYNRGVVLQTSGSSPVFASKPITVTPQAISTGPSSVSTNLRTTISRIEHRSRLVRRIAKKKAAQQKPQADAIAQGRMERKLKSQFDAQVEEKIGEARGQLAKIRAESDLQEKLVRFDIPRPTYAIYSTSDSVNANLVQAASFQLAASEPCPLPRPASSQAVIRIHQSLLVNALESFLSERTIRSTEIDELATQLVGEVPEDLELPPEDDPWEISMVAYNPIQIEFDEDRVKLALRFTRMEGRDQTISGGAVVTVTYLPRFQDGVLKLERVGDIDIQLPGVRSQNRATVLRSAARAKLEPVFQESIITEKIDLQQRFPRLPPLKVDSLRMDDGWLQLGVR